MWSDCQGLRCGQSPAVCTGRWLTGSGYRGNPAVKPPSGSDSLRDGGHLRTLFRSSDSADTTTCFADDKAAQGDTPKQGGPAPHLPQVPANSRPRTTPASRPAGAAPRGAAPSGPASNAHGVTGSRPATAPTVPGRAERRGQPLSRWLSGRRRGWQAVGRGRRGRGGGAAALGRDGGRQPGAELKFGAGPNRSSPPPAAEGGGA